MKTIALCACAQHSLLQQSGRTHVCCMQAWRAVHPAKQGGYWRRSLVHVGFLKSWTRNGLNARVTERVLSLLGTECSGSAVGCPPVAIICTGDTRQPGWLQPSPRAALPRSISCMQGASMRLGS